MRVFSEESSDGYEEYNKSLNKTQDKNKEEEHLDLTNLPLVMDIKNIDKLPNEQYALLRKNGLGTSDASTVLKVNPFSSTNMLIAEKARTYLTEEEKKVHLEEAVQKGAKLEPMIIDNFRKTFGVEIIKPSDMYRHKDFPYLAFNFDGVMGTAEQYIPVEIKVITKKGERHYDVSRALYTEWGGFQQPPDNFAQTNNSIKTKANFYGIPPYYYTQLQQQILGLNAPIGYLSVLYEHSWKFVTFLIHRDDKTIMNLILEGAKIWEQIELRRSKNNEYK